MNGPNTKTGVECEILKVYTVEEKYSTDGALNKGLWGIFPQKIFKFTVLEMPFPAFPQGINFSGNKHAGKYFRGREGYIFVSHHTIKFPTVC